MSLIFPVKTRVLLLSALALTHAVRPVEAQAQAPDAHEILRTVRAAQASQNVTMRGRIRMGGYSLPFQLVLAGKTIRYEFTDPPQTLILRLLDRDSRLEESSGGAARTVTPARFDAKVRHTDISYEDLALKFLYWPKASVQGEGTMLLRKCWKVVVEPASPRDSQYSRVMLWIDKDNGALMQAEAFDHSGKFARRFKVISGQKIDGLWFLKQMRIEAAERGRSRDRTPTYLEVQSVE